MIPANMSRRTPIIKILPSIRVTDPKCMISNPESLYPDKRGKIKDDAVTIPPMIRTQRTRSFEKYVRSILILIINTQQHKMQAYQTASVTK